MNRQLKYDKRKHVRGRIAVASKRFLSPLPFFGIQSKTSVVKILKIVIQTRVNNIPTKYVGRKTPKYNILCGGTGVMYVKTNTNMMINYIVDESY